MKVERREQRAAAVAGPWRNNGGRKGALELEAESEQEEGEMRSV